MTSHPDPRSSGWSATANVDMICRAGVPWRKSAERSVVSCTAPANGYWSGHQRQRENKSFYLHRIFSFVSGVSGTRPGSQGVARGAWQPPNPGVSPWSGSRVIVCDEREKLVALDIDALYRKYGPMVIRRCRALLIDEEQALDAAQETFVKLLRYQHRLTDAAPSSMLYTMATNVCLNMMRSARQAPAERRGRDARADCLRGQRRGPRAGPLGPGRHLRPGAGIHEDHGRHALRRRHDPGGGGLPRRAQRFRSAQAAPAAEGAHARPGGGIEMPQKQTKSASSTRRAVSDLMLEQYNLRELSPAQERVVREELERDEALRGRLAAIQGSDEELRSTYPAERVVPLIRERLLREGAGSEQRTRRLPTLAWAVPVAAVALFFSPVSPGLPPGRRHAAEGNCPAPAGVPQDSGGSGGAPPRGGCAQGRCSAAQLCRRETRATG